MLAAGLVAINPYLIYFSGLILTETIFTAMLAWAMVLVLGGRSWIWGSVILAASVLLRPSGLGLAIGLPIVGALVNRAQTWTYQVRRGLIRAAVASGLLVLVLWPWAYRNHRILGEWVWTTTNEGITRYDGFNPEATGASNQDFVKRMPWLKEMGEVQRDAFLGNEADKYVSDHPERLWSLAARKIYRTWSPKPLSNQFSKPMYLGIAMAYTLPLFLLAAMGIVLSDLGWRAKLFLLTPAIYFTLVHALTVGSLRYRIPTEPQLAILAASAAGLIRKKSIVRDEAI